MSLLQRLDARDRAMFERWVAADCTALARWFWRTITHLGGATFPSAVVLATIIAGHGRLRVAGVQAAIALAGTHLIAQLLKRVVSRPRPSGLTFEALVAAPDRFSFPSGHAIAATSVAAIYAIHYPSLAPALLPTATLVSVSRVRLGVHYPGDVIAGQAVAVIGALVVAAIW